MTKKYIFEPSKTITKLNVLPNLKPKYNTDITIDYIDQLINNKIERNHGEDKHICPANQALVALKKDEQLTLDMNGNVSKNSEQICQLDLIILRSAEKKLKENVRNTFKNNLKILKEVAFQELYELLDQATEALDQLPVEQVQFELINKYGLNDKNGYLYINEENKVDEFILEASNNGTVSIDVDKLSHKEKELSKTDILKIVAKEISEFDAEETFNDYWSESFGRNNGFSAIEFLNMLQEDEKQFKDVALRIFSDIN